MLTKFNLGFDLLQVPDRKSSVHFGDPKGHAPPPPPHQLPTYSAPPAGSSDVAAPDNLSELTEITEDAIVYALERRFRERKIYTNV